MRSGWERSTILHRIISQKKNNFHLSNLDIVRRHITRFSTEIINRSLARHLVSFDFRIRKNVG